MAKELDEYENEKNKKNNVIHSYQKGKSIYTNAIKHKNKRIIISLDILDFFDQINFFRVRGYLLNNKNYQMPIELATLISNIVCYDNGDKLTESNWNKTSVLPQGSPTSPIISNLIFSIVDYRLTKIAQKYKLTYTRYCDNLTFSTNIRYDNEKVIKIVNEISEIVENSDFPINKNKTKVMKKNKQQKVTGLIINEKINVTKKYYKETRAMCYSLFKTGKYYIDGKLEEEIDKLLGRTSYILHTEKQNLGSIEKSSKQIMYERLRFYQYFFEKKLTPIFFVEGICDKRILKSAIKRLYVDNKDNEVYNKFIFQWDNRFGMKYGYKFQIHLSDYDEENKHWNFLNIYKGGGGIKKVVEQLVSNKGHIDYLKKLTNRKVSRPIIIILDNELKNLGNENDKQLNQYPIHQVLNYLYPKKVKNKKIPSDKDGAIKKLNTEGYLEIIENVYIVLLRNKCEERIVIEDLLDDKIKKIKINGKTYSENKYKTSPEKYFGKDALSQYVENNWNSKDYTFDKFVEVFNVISKIL